MTIETKLVFEIWITQVNRLFGNLIDTPRADVIILQAVTDRLLATFQKETTIPLTGLEKEIESKLGKGVPVVHITSNPQL